jgi:competence protein ComEA
VEPPFDRIDRAREPVALQRVLAASRLHRRRLIGGAVVGIAVLVLVISVLVSATSASGTTADYATTAKPSAAAPTPTPTPTLMLVQVVGQVRHPGLVHLPAGARAIDAVTAAGGALPNADESAVNLAARVTDGEQLVLPKVGAAPVAASGAAGGGAVSSGPVSLSSASEAQLETLPRIGPAMAARIIAYRTAHGGFTRVDDLLNVGGIGAKTLAALKPLVTP